MTSVSVQVPAMTSARVHINKLSQELVKQVILYLCEAKDMVLPVRAGVYTPVSQISARWRRAVHSITSLFSNYTISLSPYFTPATENTLLAQLAHYITIWRSSRGPDATDGLAMSFAIDGSEAEFGRRVPDFADSESYLAAMDAIWKILNTYGDDFETAKFSLSEQAVIHLGIRGSPPLSRLYRLEFSMFVGQPQDDESQDTPFIESDDDENEDDPEAPVTRYRLYEESDFFSDMDALMELKFGFASLPKRTLQLGQWVIPDDLTVLDLPNVWLSYLDCVTVLREIDCLHECSLACLPPMLGGEIVQMYMPPELRNMTTHENLNYLQITFQGTLHAYMFAMFYAPHLRRLRLNSGARPPTAWSKPPQSPWMHHSYPEFRFESPELVNIEVHLHFGASSEGLDEEAIRHDTTAARQMLETKRDHDLVNVHLFWEPEVVSSRPDFAPLFAMLQRELFAGMHLTATPESVRMVKAQVGEAGKWQLERLSLHTPKRRDGDEAEYVSLMRDIYEVMLLLKGTNTGFKLVEVDDLEDHGDASGWEKVKSDDLEHFASRFASL
ncbi:hypothetical protein C8F01DRAFT_1098855 [Mycena amicta]|nr:hypothetical protein C8F01DRAFT_1098855 [Mycena amicta]